MTCESLQETHAPAPPIGIAAMRAHWPLYAIEAVLLATFMISACTFTALLEHPASIFRTMIASSSLRRALIGLAMGATAVALIYSRWGRRSGAHMNPAVTFCFWRLGKIGAWDATGYMAAQFFGGVGGVLISVILAGQFVSRPPVQYVVTMPGAYGVAAAWAAEFVISGLLMAVVLGVNRMPGLGRFTGYFAGALVALYIAFEAPVSGMSMNPARSFGSAVIAQAWAHLWIYFTAPPAGMLMAVELQRLLVGHPHNLCPRINHCPHTPSIFRCNCHAGGGIEAA